MAKKFLSFIADKYDEKEFIYPYYRLQEEGYEVDIAGTKAEEYKGKDGLAQKADITFADVNVEDYAGLVIPGGFAPDRMRQDKDALEIVRKFHEQKKPIAMICHAGWVGISAGILDGVRATATTAIKDDMVNAGVEWSDEPVIDGNIVTARNPGDLPVYVKMILELL